MAPAGREGRERYDPLPGIHRLPAFAFRHLSRRGRRVTVAAAVVLVCGAAAGAAVLVPAITTSKSERAEHERKAEARSRAAERRRLIEEQRPRARRLAEGGAGAGAQLEAAITRDARQRVRTGELPTSVRRTDCVRAGRRGGRLLYGCVAVTSVIARSESSRGGLVGYPYQAAVDLRRGRFSFCKTSGRPAEGSYTRRSGVGLPPECGGY